MLEPQTVEKEDGVLVFLTIEGSFHEEIEVRVSDQLKTIRNQIKSIVFKFGLPFVDNNGYPIQYILARAYDDVEKPEILDFVDEDGRELCMLDYNIQQGDHLRLITVPKTVKSGWFLSLAILFVTASPLIGMLFFNRNVFFDNTGIQLAVAF